MKSWGTDGTLAYTHTFSKDMSLTLRGNFTHAENKVLYWEQSGVNYPYQSYSGVPYGVQRGLIALGAYLKIKMTLIVVLNRLLWIIIVLEILNIKM